MTIETLEIIHDLLVHEADAKKAIYREAVEAHRAAVDDLNTRDDVIARLNDARGKARDEYDCICDALNSFERHEW